MLQEGGGRRARLGRGGGGGCPQEDLVSEAMYLALLRGDMKNVGSLRGWESPQEGATG